MKPMEPHINSPLMIILIYCNLSIFMTLSEPDTHFVTNI